MKKQPNTQETADTPPPNLRKAEPLAKLSESPKINRMVAANYLHKQVEADTKAKKFRGLPPAAPNYRHIWDFLKSNAGPWIWNYLKFAFSPRWPFPVYGSGGKNGVYKIKPVKAGDPVRLAIAGDWGTGTEEAWMIGDLIEKSKPDFTVHLGDVYFVGDQDEIEQNYLGMKKNGYDGVKWPKGSQGSFALNGNHEMYANGKPYFETLLPTLGMKADSKGQEASYFCLETEHWRLIALDTGYNAVGFPILSQIPGLKEIPFIGGNCHLEQSVVDWLRDVVGVKSRPMPTVLLGHHNYFSAFKEQVYTKQAKQIAPLFGGQEIIWIWGHEHRLAIYDKCKTDEGMLVHGRCLGHGGMPIDLAVPGASSAPCRFYDARSHELAGHGEVGENGFVKMSIDGGKLSLEYVDIHNKVLLAEAFSALPDGTMKYEFKDHGILTRVN